MIGLAFSVLFSGPLYVTVTATLNPPAIVASGPPSSVRLSIGASGLNVVLMSQFCWGLGRRKRNNKKISHTLAVASIGGVEGLRGGGFRGSAVTMKET
jgi:hypothetical protein